MASPLPPPAIPSRFVSGTLIPGKILMPSHPRKHRLLLRLQTKPPFSLIFQTTPFSLSPPLPPGSSNANGATPKKPPRFPVVSSLSPSIQTDINSQPLPAFHPDILSSTSLISKMKLALLLFRKAHLDTITALSYSPDGNRLASASTDRTIKIHQLNPPSLEKTLEGHNNHILSLAWSPDAVHSCLGGSRPSLQTLESENRQRNQISRWFLGRNCRHLVPRSQQPTPHRICKGAQSQ